MVLYGGPGQGTKGWPIFVLKFIYIYLKGRKKGKAQSSLPLVQPPRFPHD